MTVLRLGDTVMQRAMVSGIMGRAKASVRGHFADMTALRQDRDRSDCAGEVLELLESYSPRLRSLNWD